MSDGIRRIGARPNARPLSAQRAEAKSIVANAQREADALLADTRRELERLRADAVAGGRAEVAALLVAARVERARVLAAESSAVVAMGCAVARAVLAREAETSSDLLLRVLRRATEPLRRATVLVLRVHPQDAPTVSARLGDWMPEGMEPTALRIEPDATLDRGDAIAETEVGRVEARLDRVIEEVARILDANATVV